MTIGLTRRRFIAISAAAGLSGLGAAAFASPPAATWRGQALGAPATLTLHHPDAALARRLVAAAVAEVERLEGVFSLYRASALAELNRAGALAFPPEELVELVQRCGDFHAATEGAFDPTVQPLWQLYAGHFAAPDADPDGPPRRLVDAALDLVGIDKVEAGRQRIAFARRGMALTLNGVAQGFITDRVVALLRRAGITHSLVDMGEVSAIGSRPDGAAWQVGLAELEEGSAVRETIALVDRAVATSSPAGFHFDPAAHFTHILDPREGGTATRHACVSVVAEDAATADALSTAFCLMEPGLIEAALRRFPRAAAIIATREGGRLRLGAA